MVLYWSSSMTGFLKIINEIKKRIRFLYLQTREGPASLASTRSTTTLLQGKRQITTLRMIPWRSESSQGSGNCCCWCRTKSRQENEKRLTESDCWKGEFEKNYSQKTFSKSQLICAGTSDPHGGVQLCAGLQSRYRHSTASVALHVPNPAQGSLQTQLLCFLLL